MINFFLHYLQELLNSNLFLLSIHTLSLTIKIYFFITLLKKETQSAKNPLLLLLFILAANAFIDLSWIIKLIQLEFVPSLFKLPLFALRIAWAANIIMYQAIALLLENLVNNKFSLKKRHYTFIFISACIAIYFIGIAFYDFNCNDHSARKAFEHFMIKICIIYTLIPLTFLSIGTTALKLKFSLILPRLIRKQLKLFLFGIVLPYWASDTIQGFPFDFSPTWNSNSLPLAGLSAILTTYLVYYCSRKIIGLRFLNMQEHVSSPARFSFTDNFMAILERFSHVTNMQELRHICQSFFKESFNVPLNKTRLYIRPLQIEQEKTTVHDYDQTRTFIENFMSAHEENVCNTIKKTKIIIHDEIAFSHFYEETQETTALVNFMETINADIFLPIYEKDHLIAYIVVDRYARLQEFYSDVERDEMLIFANYLANIINLMQHKNLDTMLHQQKELKEELYRKHQETNQYKESIRSFLRSNKEKIIGILFYKNRRFTFGNKEAKDLIGINPNVQEGHPLSRELKRVALFVEEYNAPHHSFAKDNNGKTMVLSGVASLEHKHVIITVYYPEVSDIVKKQLEVLHDPSQWDYLLYLETTQSGKLINQLIPGSGQHLLNFKIDLLKTALSKKAILIDMPDEDLQPTVELLHHISLRETLHILALTGPSTNLDTPIKLFGINPIFGHQQEAQPLLEKLDDVGTLFIKNIHYLDRETQEYLADFIHYGFFKIFKSEQKIASNVRIICSSNENLQHLVQENKFSKALFNELQQTTMTMPSLITLPEEELRTLADGFSEQAIKTHTLKNLLALTDRDKTKLVHSRPASLQELKTKVQNILVNKSKKNDIYYDTQFDPAYEVTDPELIEAARLGKHALKDRKIMIMLWHKFKNQNKIATFLGVNRSSVNRRCKEYNLQ